MNKTHTIKTWVAFYQELVDGKKTFEFRQNDRNYQVGDEVIHREYDPEKEEFTGRQLFTTITYILPGGIFGVPDNFCVFGFHTTKQDDFIRDYDAISNNILPQYESKLGWKMGGSIMERLSSILNSFDSVASNSVLQAKGFVEDCKTQFKALEIIMEGLTSEGMNHGQKRVIANHIITMLRGMVDHIDRLDWDYSTRTFERYNFFRSHSPERSLMEKYRDMKRELESLKDQLKSKGQPT